MDSIKNFIYRFVSGPFFLLVTCLITYEWIYDGKYWVLFGFIPITPLLILGGLGMGFYLIKLGYIDGDVEKITKFLEHKE